MKYLHIKYLHIKNPHIKNPHIKNPHMKYLHIKNPHMKKILLFVTALALSQLALAQAQVDLKIARLIGEAKAGKAVDMTWAGVRSAAADSIRVVGKIDAEAVERFRARAEGHDFARVTAYAGGVAVVKLLVGDIERLSNTPGVTCVEFPFPIHPQMDKGRPFCGVDLVQSGSGLPGGTGFDGAGVTLVVVDSGLDFNHPAFRDKDGNTRFRLLALRDQEGNFHEVSDPQEIAGMTTDESTGTHASHVMSIAAGTEIGNGYGGVAQGADLVMVQAYYTDFPPESEGIQHNANTDIAWTLEAAQKGHDIAKRLGVPCVINMSLGNEVGARDGSDLASQFMNALTQDAIYCISAANSGAYNLHVHHTFTRDDETATISLRNYPTTGVQFFADNDRPFTLCYRAAAEGQTPVPLVAICETGTLVIDGSNADDPLVRKLQPYISRSDFRIEMRSVIYHNGNRLVEIYTYNCFPRGAYTNFQLELAADNGTHIDGHVFMFNGGFVSYSYAGDMRPDNNGSISVFATGTNAISVGAMAARSTVPLIDGTETDVCGYGTATGDIAPFSSWIAYPDGSSLPHIAAPGYNVVAAGNSHCKDGFDGNLVRIDERFGRQAHYISISGTSMAAPYTAGVVALWLQANPDLTAADIRAIMRKTARTNAYMEQCPEPARWGWGILDAHAGIKEALAIPTAIVDATRETPQIVRLDANTLETASATASLYTVAGTLVAITSTGSIDLRAIPHGIYFVKTPGGTAVKVRL